MEGHGDIVKEGHGDRAAECSKSKRRAALLIGDSCEPHFDQCSDAERKKPNSATIGTSLYHCVTNCVPFGPLLTTHLKATHGIFVPHSKAYQKKQREKNLKIIRRTKKVKLEVGLGLSIATRRKALRTHVLTALTKSTIRKMTQPLLKPHVTSFNSHIHSPHWKSKANFIQFSIRSSVSQ